MGDYRNLQIRRQHELDCHAQDRLEAGFGAGAGKGDCAIQRVCVGEGQRTHPIRRRLRNQIWNRSGAAEQGIVRVDV